MLSIGWEGYLKLGPGYHRETALQGGLVMAKSERLELGDNNTDIIGLSSTTVTYLASKETEIREKNAK